MFATATARWFLTPLALVAVVVSAHADELPNFTQLVEQAGPAVVNIQSTSNAQPEGQDQQVPEIFRRFFGPGQMPPAPQQGQRVSAGSGFIISRDGYILTNNHVVDGADTVTVRLVDRRELDAKVVGTDPQTDIALLKINATGLPTVKLGDSTKLKPGQWVVAVGSPFGMDHSVTHGIVSALGRGYDRSQQYVPFIQTDVPINPGNSGGPLFNLDGEVVGINSQIFSNTGGYMGMSFAIPIRVAMNTVDQLKATGKVSRGMIGVQIQGVGRADAQALGLPRSGGALVNAVSPGSAAEKAGVKLGDVILSFNGADVVTSNDLPPMVGLTKPGSSAQLGIFRDGKNMTLPITVGEQPADANVIAAMPGGAAVGVNKLGIVVDNMTPEQRSQIGVKDGGVVVTRISGVAAQSTPLQPGDIVLRVGRSSVKSATDFNSAVKDINAGESVMLLVQRGETTQFVAVTVPKSAADKQ